MQSERELYLGLTVGERTAEVQIVRYATKRGMQLQIQHLRVKGWPEIYGGGQQ